MSQEIYGIPFPFPPDIDYYMLNAVDIGFIASLALGVNESYSFYLPLPGSIRRREQTIVVHALEFIQQINHFHQDDQPGQLAVHLSTRGEVPIITSDLIYAAAADDFWKSQFMRNIMFGHSWYTPTDTAGVDKAQWRMDTVTDAWVALPVPLDQWARPMHIHFTAQGATIDPATNDETAVAFTPFAQTTTVVWFTVRDLTQDEMDDTQTNASSRFAIRDT